MSSLRYHCQAKVDGAPLPRFPVERLFTDVNAFNPQAVIETADDTTTLAFEGTDIAVWSVVRIAVSNRCVAALIGDSPTAAGRTILRPGGFLFLGSTGGTTGVPAVRALAVPCEIDALVATDSLDLAP